jgi:hypothetical protein
MMFCVFFWTGWKILSSIEGWKLSDCHKGSRTITASAHLKVFPELHSSLQKKKKISPATCHSGAWGQRRYSSYTFLTSVLHGGEWSASRPVRTLPREKIPGTHCTGGWVGPRAGLDTEVRGDILCPCRESKPDRSVVQSVVNSSLHPNEFK